MYVAHDYLFGSPDACSSVCGPGTAWVDGHCELAPEDEEPIAAEPEPPSKTKRRGKRGKQGSDDEAEAGIELAAGGPPIDDDSHVPRFDANADQTISMSDGTGRLSDAEIDRELGKLDGAFQACVRDAAARVESLGTGTVKYSFGVDGKGKVTGVNASAPQALEDAGIIPCVRKAVYAHRFPAFDGPTMKVGSSFRVD
jgi:hypothetical protein